MVDVQLTRVDFPAAMADSVYKRMIAERQQIAADERAKGAAEADKIKADAVAQQQAILATATARRRPSRARAMRKPPRSPRRRTAATRSSIQFYQACEAYRNTFEPGDVIVVDPSSEFFRFMRSSTGGAAPDASAASRKH